MLMMMVMMMTIVTVVIPIPHHRLLGSTVLELMNVPLDTFAHCLFSSLNVPVEAHIVLLAPESKELCAQRVTTVQILQQRSGVPKDLIAAPVQHSRLLVMFS
jgi:hypothetical protein